MDPIADMLTIIRNGFAVDKSNVLIPYSKVKEETLKLLKGQGYLKSIKKVEQGNRQFLKAGLKYKDGKPVISEIERVSKPGRRVYLKTDEIKPYLPRAGKGQELGLVIISTSKGLMTSNQARKKQIGGEIMFKVY